MAHVRVDYRHNCPVETDEGERTVSIWSKVKEGIYFFKFKELPVCVYCDCEFEFIGKKVYW